MQGNVAAPPRRRMRGKRGGARFVGVQPHHLAGQAYQGNRSWRDYVSGSWPIAGATGRDRARSLIGEEGRAATDLKPVGTCIINGQRMDCLSTAGQIKAGTKVRVVFADGIQIKVKAEE